jgi:hypothetical protein
MAGDETPGADATTNLTEQQKRLLADALTEVKLQVFQHTVKRLKVYLGILVAVIGVESFFLGWGIRKDVIDAASAALVHDSAIRDNIEKSANERINTVVERVEDNGSARLADLGRSLEEANKMLEVATRVGDREGPRVAVTTRAPE